MNPNISFVEIEILPFLSVCWMNAYMSSNSTNCEWSVLCCVSILLQNYFLEWLFDNLALLTNRINFHFDARNSKYFLHKSNFLSWERPEKYITSYLVKRLITLDSGRQRPELNDVEKINDILQVKYQWSNHSITRPL